uniref:BTB domain-containing protein n=1 Tax=Panagrolaimus sp. PS1159 TaxID=55785 RepID=A0AC35F309_9BILA
MAPRTRRSVSRMSAREVICVDSEAQTSSFGSSPLYKATKILFQTKKGADVTFILEQKEILAHKSFLIARSTVFEAMFIGAMASTDSHPKISLNNYIANVTDFETFLEYLYTDQIDINLQNVYAIFKLAHLYDISSLLEECATFLQNNIELSNILEISTFSYLYQESCSLFNDSLEFICKNAMKVFYLPEFNKLDATIVAEILKCDNLKVKENDLFDIIYEWAIEETKRHDLEVTIRNIRSPRATPSRKRKYFEF